MRGTQSRSATMTIATPHHSETKNIPTIRLISATPSASGNSSTSSAHQLAVEASWSSIPAVPSPLAPKSDSSPRKRLVPKKSKLSMLSSALVREKERGKDLSDVVRRVGVPSSASTRGFDIYVDPSIEDNSVGDIVVVKKKKSRGALDGMKWGALGEVTNVPAVSALKEPQPAALLKVKGDDSQKWWSIGRGRKDSKEKSKEGKENVDKTKGRAKSPEPQATLREASSRSKTPEPLRLAQATEPSRARFNSLDSGILLNTPVNMGPSFANAQDVMPPRAGTPTSITFTRVGTPTAGGLLAPPVADGLAPPSQNHGGSIAIRAMRSVRSLARIGSWAQLKHSDEAAAAAGSVHMKSVKEKAKEKDGKEKEHKESKKKKEKKEKKENAVEGAEEGKKKKKKEKKEKEKDDKLKTGTVRLSSSSFEIGSASPMPKEKEKTLGKKKHSILGLGLPSSMTMRLPTVRSGSTTSSVMAPPATTGVSAASRLSIESAHILAQQGRDRSSSVMSTSTMSSLRPISVTSSRSGEGSSGGSSCGVSVKWDEEGLQAGRELRRKERKEREAREKEEREAEKVKSKGKKLKKEGKKEKEKEGSGRRSVEGQRRTPLSEVFPANYAGAPEPVETEGWPLPPIVTVESATCDGHSVGGDDGSVLSQEPMAMGTEEDEKLATPVKRARPRPMSEQLLGRGRPKCYEGDDGVLSILDAATNDLAQLISHLDLEATPATPDMTPLRPYGSSVKKDGSPGGYEDDSPIKKQRLGISGSPSGRPHINSMSSVSSLRPYAQSRKNFVPPALPSGPPSANLQIGQQITPWSVLMEDLSPAKSSAKTSASPRTSKTPPSTFRLGHKRTMTPAPEPEPAPVFLPLRPPSHKFSTLKLMGSSLFDESTNGEGTVRGLAPSPVFKRHRPSVVPRDVGDESNPTIPITPETRRMLGMGGTLGAEVSFELDASDPDSDVPDELRIILSSSETDTLSFVGQEGPSLSPGSPPSLPLPSLSTPPVLELPSFHAHLIDEEENQMELVEEEDTKKSFDFTGEIQKLNESGASDRASFVEQLENAFKTPAKIDFRRIAGTLLAVDVPSVPKVPSLSAQMGGEGSMSGSSSGFESLSGSGSKIVDVEEPSLLHFNMTSTEDSEETEDSRSIKFDLFSGSETRLVDVKEPTMLSGSDSLATDIVMDDSGIGPFRGLKPSSSTSSRPSNGQLNTAFKFGGVPKAAAAPSPAKVEKPVTLSDIIPPPSHFRSISDSSLMIDDDSVLKSIFAKASDMPPPRMRVDSGASAMRRAMYRHSRHSSGMSFSGFDSFDEVRRGFEASDSQPFYPPPAARRNYQGHGRHESVFSIASVSSYGRAMDYGLPDPFDYGLPSLRERPSSEDMSMMSSNIDDTFSFIRRQPRRRVDSDASSFYFKAPLSGSYNRGHRRYESNMSVTSQAPPVSLYNRSFGTHRRNDSTSSAQSVALSYARHGADGGRAAWARHARDTSMDSLMSDFSMVRLGRPGLGDKMFDTSGDQGIPLPAISASPVESVASRRYDNDHRSSFDFDSIMGEEHKLSMDDSLFDKTGYKSASSVTSESVFGGDEVEAPRANLLPLPQYRRLSVLSFGRPHSPVKEDDTMISMLGGGHVRRRSMDSVVDASPCVRVEKRKHSELRGMNFGLDEFGAFSDSPNKARIVEKPSIASTSSADFAFGGERMIKARRGLLERQSLEDSCLIADGEDLSGSFDVIPVFSRPTRATRSRSSTCTSSSGGDTPPMTDGFSSMDEGSQSSIDLSQINFSLANATFPMSTLNRHRIRARARGHGHRRRASQARASRSSVYETIEEEIADSLSPVKPSPVSMKNSPTVRQPIFIMEPDAAPLDNGSSEESVWDGENGIVTLRKYYALRDEAESTVTESKLQWIDTPFSLFAVQTFEPPRHPAGMQALLEHSVQNYGPLPSELHPRRMRSRTQSRPSPYPARSVKLAPRSPENLKMQPVNVSAVNTRLVDKPVLQQLPINHNISAVSALNQVKPLSPLVAKLEPKRENAFGLAPNARPRVGSTARRNALGWSKRSNGKTSSDLKENVGQGTIMTPGESLRINRPRPRGRQTPASTARPIRV